MKNKALGDALRQQQFVTDSVPSVVHLDAPSRSIVREWADRGVVSWPCGCRGIGSCSATERRHGRWRAGRPLSCAAFWALSQDDLVVVPVGLRGAQVGVVTGPPCESQGEPDSRFRFQCEVVWIGTF